MRCASIAAGVVGHEEAGIVPQEMTHRGILEFEFFGEKEILEVHVFHVDKFAGEPTESEEMRPQWYHVDKIPFADMWLDDQHWFPLFLAGKHFRGRFLFNEKGEELKEIKFLEEINGRG